MFQSTVCRFTHGREKHHELSVLLRAFDLDRTSSATVALMMRFTCSDAELVGGGQPVGGAESPAISSDSVTSIAEEARSSSDSHVPPARAPCLSCRDTPRSGGWRRTLGRVVSPSAHSGIPASSTEKACGKYGVMLGDNVTAS